LQGMHLWSRIPRNKGTYKDRQAELDAMGFDLAATSQEEVEEAVNMALQDVQAAHMGDLCTAGLRGAFR
jgi:hypothetical protein